MRQPTEHLKESNYWQSMETLFECGPIVAIYSVLAGNLPTSQMRA